MEEEAPAVGPDGGRARPVFAGVHHPADVGLLGRVGAVAGFLLPRHLEQKQIHEIQKMMNRKSVMFGER